MRQYSKPRSTGFFSGRELLRVLSLLFMLAIVGITIFRFRASTQAVKLAESATSTAPQPPQTETSNSPVAAPLDVTAADSPAEQAAFAHETQAVMDLATAIHAVEMPAYNRLLQWVDRLGPTDKKQAPEITFHDLVKKPNQNRGRLMHVKLRVRRVQSYVLPTDEAEQARTVYELWGWPVAADGWLYVVVTPELPKGFPTEGQIDETADVYGYFFKLQGYHPAESKPNAKPLAAPLIMGLVDWQPAAVIRQQRPISPGAVAALGLLIVSLAAYWLWPRKKQPLRTSAADLDEMPLGYDTLDETTSASDYKEEFAEPDDDESSPEARENSFGRQRGELFE